MYIPVPVLVPVPGAGIPGTGAALLTNPSAIIIILVPRLGSSCSCPDDRTSRANDSRRRVRQRNMAARRAPGSLHRADRSRRLPLWLQCCCSRGRQGRHRGMVGANCVNIQLALLVCAAWRCSRLACVRARLFAPRPTAGNVHWRSPLGLRSHRQRSSLQHGLLNCMSCGHRTWRRLLHAGQTALRPRSPFGRIDSASCLCTSSRDRYPLRTGDRLPHIQLACAARSRWPACACPSSRRPDMDAGEPPMDQGATGRTSSHEPCQPTGRTGRGRRPTGRHIHLPPQSAGWRPSRHCRHCCLGYSCRFKCSRCLWHHHGMQQGCATDGINSETERGDFQLTSRSRCFARPLQSAHRSTRACVLTRAHVHTASPISSPVYPSVHRRMHAHSHVHTRGRLGPSQAPSPSWSTPPSSRVAWEAARRADPR